MKYLGFDNRALALMRMSIAAVLMFDIGIRVSDLEAFYTNTGATPLSMIFEHTWNDYFISLHAISGLWTVQLILFLFAFVLAILLFIGFRTRLVTILSWIMLVSLHNRNTLILQGGDDLLRIVLFWAMFIPWGKRYSYDSYRESTRVFTHSQISRIAVFAYLIQIVYIYSGSALLKGPEWHTNYTALYYAYSLDQIAYPFSKLIYYYPELLKKLTCLTYYFELLIPILFFIPYKHQLFRSLGVISIIVFHIFNSQSLLIGLFPIIGIATVIGILPSNFITWVENNLLKLKCSIKQSFVTIGNYINKYLRWKTDKQISNTYVKNAISGVLIFLMVLVLDWNFSNLSFIHSKLSDKIRFIGYTLRLDQSWGMFAPGVFKDDGWYILEGKSENDKTFNLLNPTEQINYKKPELIVKMFKNDRWRKYSENYLFDNNNYMRGYFCNYYLRVWNEQNPENKIISLSIIYMKEFTLPDYRYSKPQLIRLCNCEKQR